MHKKLFLIAATPILAFILSACDVKKTQEGEAPKVDVEGGQVPKYEVDTPDVDVKSQEKQIDAPVVGTEKREVDVPVVGTEKKSVDVPDVEVTPADADKNKQ